MLEALHTQVSREARLVGSKKRVIPPGTGHREAAPPKRPGTPLAREKPYLQHRVYKMYSAHPLFRVCRFYVVYLAFLP